MVQSFRAWVWMSDCLNWDLSYPTCNNYVILHKLFLHPLFSFPMHAVGIIMAFYQWTVADIALYNEWKAISKHEDQHACMTTGKGSI